jgi:DNA-directed RNA polymerase subunit E'/Rpb7
VISLSREGFHAQCGPLQVFVHYKNFGDTLLRYDDAEPTMPKFVSSELVVGLQNIVRVKILSDSYKENNPICIGALIRQQ